MLVTLKDKDSIWIATSTNSSRRHVQDTLLEENLSIFRVANAENAIIASTGPAGIDLDQIRYCEDLPLSQTLTKNRLLLQIIPKIKSICEENEMMDDDESMRELIIAKDGKAFTVLPTFTCHELEDFYTTGNGASIGHGAMLYYRDLPPIERIVESFRAVAEGSNNRIFPIVIMNTKQKERIVINQ